MPGYTRYENIVIAVLLVAFLSVLFKWHQYGHNVHNKPEDVKKKNFPQQWSSINQTKSRQFKEYTFPSEVKGEILVLRLQFQEY